MSNQGPGPDVCDTYIITVQAVERAQQFPAVGAKPLGQVAAEVAGPVGGNAGQVGGKLPASQDVRNMAALGIRARHAWWGNVLPAQVGGQGAQGAPQAVRVAHSAQPVATGMNGQEWENG